MMPFHRPLRPATWLWQATMPVIVALAMCPAVWGQQQLTQPVYRVSHESSSSDASVVAPAVGQTGSSPFDLTQRPGEHPLTPFIRTAKASLEQIDRNVRDYSCTFVKRERIDGELGDYQHIFMKVRHEPFSVYMSFLRPYAGREVLYVDGQNNNELLVLECGWKRKMLGTLQLDPDGPVAMRGQKYAITNVGIRNLVAKLLVVAEADTQYAECDVTTNPNTKINGRSTTMFQIVHPIPRQNFRSHIARVFFDNELKVPIHYDAFLWPAQPGQPPPPDESYTYSDLKINNQFTGRDFDPNNPEIFKM